VPEFTFSDLPKVGSEDELRAVHHTAGQFLVKRAGKAHSSMNCDHLSDSVLVDNPAWRVASGAQCRELGIPWCEDC
jgi:hypothetical protein